MRRPLAFITAAYCAGILVARLLYPLSREILIAFILLGGLLTALLLLLLPRFALQRTPAALFLPFFFLVALANYQAAADGIGGNLAPFAGERVLLEGVVAAEPVAYPDRVVYLLEACRVEGEGGNPGEGIPVFGRVRLVVDLGREAPEFPAGEADGRHFAYGDCLRVEGRLSLPTGPRNPGGFDRFKFLLSQGAGAEIYVKPDEARVLPPAEKPRGLTDSFLQRIYVLKNRTLALFRENLPSERAALLGGILFGRRSGLSPGVEENFRASGVSHLLAVSGLHVGMLAFLAVKLWGLLGVKGERAFLLSLPFAALFTLFTGFRPAVLRAFLMLVILAASQGLGRDRDFPSALALSALVSLLINPLFLFMPGFQLSYAGIAAIIYFYEDFTRYFSFLPKFLRGIAAASLAAQLGVAPLTAFYFQQVSLVALLTNLLLVAAMAPLLGGGLAGALLVNLWPPGGGLAIRLLSPLLAFFLAATGFFASLPFAVVKVPHMSPYALLLAYGAYLACLNRQRLRSWLPALKAFTRRHIFPLLLALILLVALGLVQEIREEGLLEVTFLDVGQGASVFIRTPAGRNILVDTGGALFPHSRDPGEDVLLPFFRHRGVKSLDLLFISHPHVDHYGGAFALMGRYPPGVLAVGSSTGEEGYRELLRRAADRGAGLKVLSRGSRLPLGPGLELLVLHPWSGPWPADSSTAENDNSLVLKLTYHDVSFLFTGDIEVAGEAFLMESPRDLKSTFLQVPHHGSSTSSGAAFLQAVGPVAAVIPVGSNPFGHPAPRVLDRLAAEGVEIYRTDVHGAVTIRTDGRDYTVETMLPGAFVRDNGGGL